MRPRLAHLTRRRAPDIVGHRRRERRWDGQWPLCARPWARLYPRIRRRSIVSTKTVGAFCVLSLGCLNVYGCLSVDQLVDESSAGVLDQSLLLNSKVRSLEGTRRTTNPGSGNSALIVSIGIA